MCALVPSWGHLGPSWGYLGAILESSWGHLGTTWEHIGSTLGCEHQSVEQHTFWSQRRWAACSNFVKFWLKKHVDLKLVLKGSARRTSKTQIIWKYKNRSRITPVQRRRSSVPTHIQKCQSVPAEIFIKPWNTHDLFNDFTGHLVDVDPTKIEAKCPRGRTL